MHGNNHNNTFDVCARVTKTEGGPSILFTMPLLESSINVSAIVCCCFFFIWRPVQLCTAIRKSPFSCFEETVVLFADEVLMLTDAPIRIAKEVVSLQTMNVFHLDIFICYIDSANDCFIPH